MKSENLIALTEICTHHQIEPSFILSLKDSGLIQLDIIEEGFFIDHHQLAQLEKYIEFYYTLGINLEGIEAISHLLQRMNILQEELAKMKNTVTFHECAE
jgi:chaperone modulatory protein CbpM